MQCAIHVLTPTDRLPRVFLGVAMIPEASTTVFGLTLCERHTVEVARALVGGASVREILAEALEGEWA